MRFEELARGGMRAERERRRCRQRGEPVGIRVDVTDVGEALEVLE